VALTGTGAKEGFDQEALEYLGDAVLKFLASNYLLQVRGHRGGGAWRVHTGVFYAHPILIL
jgi:hypothetical protein